MLVFILFILAGGYILERWLDYINSKNFKTELPGELHGIYDAEKYSLSQQYERAGKRLSFYSSTTSLLITVTLLSTGTFATIYSKVLTITSDPVWSCLLFFAVIAVAADILSLPFSLYSIFVIEEKFGFNKMTVRTFIMDKIKSFLLGGIIGGALLALFILFYQKAGSNFWIYAWVLFSLFMLLLTMFYSSWILPLFNKLQPLPEGSLRTAIENYCSKVGFTLDNLFVMDGSKRSSKANAFFSGLGKKKRIVLYDTLIRNHTDDELVAVLAHEIGHYKKKHTRTGFILSIAQMGLMLFIFSRCINSPSLSQALGSPVAALPLGMLAFAIVYSPVSMLIGIFMNMLSRRNEFEADHYASVTFNGDALKNALKKLSVNNLSNLLPHPIYVFFYYSHPTLLQRLNAISTVMKNG